MIRPPPRASRTDTRLPYTTPFRSFQAIGTAASKLGQALATRPDLVGEEAASDLLRLQDALPPVPFDTIREAMRASFGQPLDALFTARSEEHTSELQSLMRISYAVFCLKKKKTEYQTH